DQSSQFAECLEAPFTDDAKRRLAHGGKHAADIPVFCLNGAIRVREIRFLGIVIAVHGKKQVIRPRGGSGLDDTAHLRADDVPDFWPDFPAGPPETLTIFG